MFYWILGYNTSLYRVSGSKIMAKIPQINYGNPRKFLTEFLKYFEFFWHKY